MEVMRYFSSYMDIPQIKQLADEVRQIEIELAQQITSDFKEAFSGQNPKHFAQLTEGCLVLSVLDPKVKWVCQLINGKSFFTISKFVSLECSEISKNGRRKIRRYSPKIQTFPKFCMIRFWIFDLIVLFLFSLILTNQTRFACLVRWDTTTRIRSFVRRESGLRVVG